MWTTHGVRKMMCEGVVAAQPLREPIPDLVPLALIQRISERLWEEGGGLDHSYLRDRSQGESLRKQPGP